VREGGEDGVELIEIAESARSTVSHHTSGQIEGVGRLELEHRTAATGLAQIAHGLPDRAP
jgi:hypothetical protein